VYHIWSGQIANQKKQVFVTSISRSYSMLKLIRHPIYGWFIAGLLLYTAYHYDSIFIAICAGVFTWVAFTETLDYYDGP
jgi:protein-S-isoprenylcysteine O-methyltransferase Ste14